MKNHLLHSSSIVFILFFISGTVFAQVNQFSKSDSTGVNTYSEGLSGVVVANTFSAAGYQFYNSFALAWRDKPESEKYSLSVVESRGRQRVSQVTVYYANKTLYSAVLPTKYAALQVLVDQSMDAITSKLLTLELDSMESEPDIASDSD
jgi:hypothetical protein